MMTLATRCTCDYMRHEPDLHTLLRVDGGVATGQLRLRAHCKAPLLRAPVVVGEGREAQLRAR
eukprot:9382195-Alexandrium_andersonii.AAC.1